MRAVKRRAKAAARALLSTQRLGLSVTPRVPNGSGSKTVKSTLETGVPKSKPCVRADGDLAISDTAVPSSGAPNIP